MKNIFIILFFFLLNTSLFSNDIAIKLLENSYKQLNKDLLECQVEEKRINVNSSNLADHLTLRSKIEELEKRRADLKTMLNQLIKNHKKTSPKNNKKKNDNNESDKEKQTGSTKNHSKKEKAEDDQTENKNETGTQIAYKKIEQKPPAQIVKPKEQATIQVSKKVVKPGDKLTYTVIPPKHFLNPQIVWIKCSSNLGTLSGSPMAKQMSGYLVADSLITREENAYIAALIVDLSPQRLYSNARTAVVISAYTQEQKLTLNIPSRTVSGHSYNFIIKVPPDFKRPLYIIVKSLAGRHVIVHSSATSLAGSIKVWGNGKRNVILSGSISAKVYDDSGKIGYVRKSFSIDEPTQAEMDKLPMEQPPTWYEEAATFAWKATKTGLKATGAAMKTTGQVMKAMAKAEAQHGYLKNASRQPGYTPHPRTPTPKYNLKPPPKPSWMTPKPRKPSDPNAQNLGIITTRYPSITVVAWDHGTEDGDKVKFSLNASALGAMSLKKAKQRFNVSLRVGHNEIKITALNEGSQSPNTASFEVYDRTGKLTKKSWDLKTGKSAILITIYKP